MPTLLETQRAIRAALFEQLPGAAPDAAALNTAAPDAVDRLASLDPLALAIHRNTCRHTLIAALALSFPVVKRLVGAEFFEGAAYAFIERHLPMSACLDDYGEELAPFLQEFPPAASVPYLGEVARLEWAVNRALHADDADRLDLERLAARDEHALANLAFVPHPALALLRLKYPADEIWRAVLESDAAAMAAVDLTSGPVHLLIERDGAAVQVRRLSRAAWELTRELVAGTTLGAALRSIAPATAIATAIATATATATASERLDAVLADHLASGRFIDFRESNS